MTKFTRKQVREIELALENLKSARDYIMQRDIAVCRRVEKATTSLHYKRADGRVLYEVEKTYGSELCQLEGGISRLEQILQEGRK